ncbi:NADPH-dependent F420 reductase [Nocardia arthritidis]|uniref:NADP oxidoreductase n=1 Tax=Nocardia arthritidis TaxID=228602 RepID=A0A6G9YU22_9NOCA|nr:NAD(P)-binding domain-containing protein [Nocardia arthritidis]QIS16708.1 NADP oxidoreductase [Nocardia arthritidis]
MKIAVFGTGEVGRRLASKLVELGHAVTLGSRTADNAAASEWARETGGAHGTFADAAADAELIVNATAGTASVAALTAAGAANLSGKVIIDVSNGLEFTSGGPKLVIPEAGSVAEELQRAFPEARVVKTLNTMNNKTMVDPSRVPGPHNVFLSGDDATAKADVAGLLRSFGWGSEQIIDLGDLSTARSTEPLVMLWINLSRTFGTENINLAVRHD